MQVAAVVTHKQRVRVGVVVHIERRGVRVLFAILERHADHARGACRATRPGRVASRANLRVAEHMVRSRRRRRCALARLPTDNPQYRSPRRRILHVRHLGPIARQDRRGQRLARAAVVRPVHRWIRRRAGRVVQIAVRNNVRLPTGGARDPGVVHHVIAAARAVGQQRPLGRKLSRAHRRGRSQVHAPVRLHQLPIPAAPPERLLLQPPPQLLNLVARLVDDLRPLVHRPLAHRVVIAAWAGEHRVVVAPVLRNSALPIHRS